MEDEENIPIIEEVEQAQYDEHGDYNDYVAEGQEDQQFGSYPGAKAKDSIFTFFNNILRLKDSTKVSNLDKFELGKLDLSVRSCEYLAKLGYMLHNKSYGDWFMTKAEITLASSMSKKGWLPELVVSQKKFSQRTVQPMSVPAAAVPAKKGGFFGSKPDQPSV